MIEMIVTGVRINLATQQRVVILKSKTDERSMFIWIAHAEAYAIAVQLQGTTPPRPLTHDLLKNIIEGMGATIVRVEVSAIVDDIFYARIVLDVAGKQVEFDARPSDAFALAIRANAPIFVAESILERIGVVEESILERIGMVPGTREEARAPETGLEQETAQKTEIEAEVEQATPETSGDEMTQLRKENEALKEQLAKIQNNLEAAQRRIVELENT